MTFRAIIAGFLTAALLVVLSNPIEAAETKVVAKKTAKPIPSP